MVGTLGSRAKSKPTNDEEKEKEKVKLGYEKYREERIKENAGRLQKLGIINLSLSLNSNPDTNNCHGRSPNGRKSVSALNSLNPPNPLPHIEINKPLRRSTRLKNADPVQYAEICSNQGEMFLDKKSGRLALVGQGEREEVYTEEHYALLGSCETSWELFVDGYDRQGKRVYDQVSGKTCHQCRQKTLGHHTRCSKCDLVQGQFYGDCLYMRYGENVLEAKKNLNWICPVCRDICNCSICRAKKGWAPTGNLYRKVTNLGFKSVAHYLIQTRRSLKDSGDDNDTLTASSNALVSCSNVKEFPDPKHSSDSMYGSDCSQCDDTNSNTSNMKLISLAKNEEPLDPHESLHKETGLDPDSCEKSNNRHNSGSIDNKTKQVADATADVEKRGQDSIAGRLRKRVRST